MAGQHVTVILGNGGSGHYHGDVMYDEQEKILVVTLIGGGAAHFNVEFVAAWITSPLSDEDEQRIIEAIAAGEDYGDI
jgi:hypothetical protein